MSTDRLREIEIDSGLQRTDDNAATRVHLTLREHGGQRRVLADVVLGAEQLFAIARGTPVRANGMVPREFEGGDALLDALDRVTSGDGQRTTRAPAEIAEALLHVVTVGHGLSRVPFDGITAVRRALRGTTPRPIPEKD